MEHIKRILSGTRRALDDYRMINPNDRIAVGVSAGKDSPRIQLFGRMRPTRKEKTPRAERYNAHLKNSMLSSDEKCKRLLS